MNSIEAEMRARRTRASINQRTRTNPALWKFAVAVPVLAGMSYLLYRYVLVNDAQAAQSSSQTPVSLSTQKTLKTSYPTSGQACFAGKVGNATVKIQMVFGVQPVDPWGESKTTWSNKPGEATGRIYLGQEEIARFKLNPSTFLGQLNAKLSGDNSVDAWVRSNFKVRKSYIIGDAGFMLPSGTLPKVSC